MKYAFRTTYRQDADTYVEDRGYAHEVKRGHPDFEAVEAEFGDILKPGQTASRGMGDVWEVSDGFPLLADMKAIKLERLKVAWLHTEAHGKVRINNKNGESFVIDATERANRDIGGLIDSMEYASQEKDLFCDAENQMHEVTLAELREMRQAVVAFGRATYARKWLLREQIEAAKTCAELDAIEISF